MSDRINVREIFDNALKDPSLFSTLDIEHLLDTIESTKNDYLDNKTMKTVNEDVYTKIAELKLTKEKSKEMCNKLIGYRLVEEIFELHRGKHIRWIRTTSGERILTNGGIIVNVKCLDNGVYIVCMNTARRFMQFKFDDCITFQKLNTEEQLLLMAYEKLDTDS
jgi:hypothetical protein